MTNPLIQIDDEVREMTAEELAVYQLTIDEKATREAKACRNKACRKRHQKRQSRARSDSPDGLAAWQEDVWVQYRDVRPPHGAVYREGYGA